MTHPFDPAEQHAFQVRVPGIPIPQGSKRLGRNSATGRAVLIDDNDASLRLWRSTVQLHCNQSSVRFAKHVPLTCHLSFTLPRPPSVPPSKRALPSVKPDLDKLTRAVFDALTEARVWVDDGQVVFLAASKQYPVAGVPVGCHIRVGRA